MSLIDEVPDAMPDTQPRELAKADAARRGTPASAAYRAGQSLAELAELRLALETSRKDSRIMRQQRARLVDTVSRLNHKVLQLEQDLVQARHSAYHDDLTGLPNRSLLLDRLNQAIAHAARQNKLVGLLFLDLDDFKQINDEFGHAVGDKVLQRVAQRLLSCIRNADTSSRFGGDEFVVLLPGVDSRKGAVETAHKIRDHLSRPYVIDDRPVAVTASVGVAVYPGDGSSQDELIRRADSAMYLNKDKRNVSDQLLTDGSE